MGVVVALRVTLLCKHEVSLCIVWTSSSFNFASSVGHRRSQEFSASVSKMSVNCHWSGRCQSMSETNCARINVRSMSVDVRDSMSETQSQRLDVRDLMSEMQCQRRNVRDSLSEMQCQRLNVRDAMSETQCQRLNVRDSMSETQCQRLYHQQDVNWSGSHMQTSQTVW